MRRIAIVHEWMGSYAGSERVVEEILHLFPEADLFCMVDFLPSAERSFLQGKPVVTSFVQRLPGARKHYRTYLPLMPLAVEQFDLSQYELVISSSHAVAKGVLTGANQLHLSYVHTPLRYAWDLQGQYLAAAGMNGVKSAVARLLMHYMRLWDSPTANGVDAFAANSAFVARRIWKTYRRTSTVIYPPVDIDFFVPFGERKSFYLTVSRIVSQKKVDLIVDAFARTPERQLVVIGDGPELAKIRAKAGPNVELLGHQPIHVVKEHMQRARAFVFAAEEDFGIAAVEAQACGTPVIAYGRGGLAETVVEGQTGLFFAEQTPGSLIEAMATFETLRARFDSDLIRRNAERFSRQRFQQEFSAFVEREYAAFLANVGVASSARQRIPQTNQSLKVAGSLPDGCPAEFERG